MWAKIKKILSHMPRDRFYLCVRQCFDGQNLNEIEFYSLNDFQICLDSNWTCYSFESTISFSVSTPLLHKLFLHFLSEFHRFPMLAQEWLKGSLSEEVKINFRVENVLPG